MNDITGDQKPYDYLYEGTDAKVFGDLTVWNWGVLNAIMERAAPSLAIIGTPTDGLDAVGSIGTLMVTEGIAYQLWIHFPYSTGPGNNAATGAHAAYTTMVGGYRFLAAWLLGPDEIDPGTKANKIHVQFHCQKTRVGTAGNMRLYDNVMTALPVTAPVTTL